MKLLGSTKSKITKDEDCKLEFRISKLEFRISSSFKWLSVRLQTKW